MYDREHRGYALYTSFGTSDLPVTFGVLRKEGSGVQTLICRCRHHVKFDDKEDGSVMSIANSAHSAQDGPRAERRLA